MNLSKELANAIRILSIDAVEQAQSGHPGMPLGMADIATVLWHKFLKYNPLNPHWFNRDRFVLSNGHGSMLLYSLLHLSGYKLPIEELKNFRQLHSKTPGHPELGHTTGVETTTGPLGQGLANSVGLAIAEKLLAQEFNHEHFPIISHYTYVFAGDGCLMEGISHEACSLAGTLKLNKLIVFYDNNGISIDGPVNSWFTDDTCQRFQSYNWQVINHVNGHDMDAIEQAILQAQHNTTQPSLIICNTVIGLGSAVAGSEKSHGAPLGATDIAQVRSHFDWDYPPFTIPEHIYQQWNHEDQGTHEEEQWLNLLAQYREAYPIQYFELLRRANGDLPDDWSSYSQAFLEECRANSKAIATRKSSQQCIEHFAKILPEMLGGSADLTSSNNTNWSGSKMLTADDFSGNYIGYGVREFGMAAIMNGLAVHGGFIPYGGTFLVFADYARNAIRLSALMKQRVIYVFTHDSIGLGEDGPTHQPVEHASMLRMTPNIQVWRPADLLETAVAWKHALEHHNGPSALLLSRQNLPALSHTVKTADSIARGAYAILDCDGEPDALLIATGSEVQIALETAQVASAKGLKIRIISMPCVERFIEQESSYKNYLLPTSVRTRIAIEAASSAYWYQFVGLDGVVIGIDQFGVSAPAADAYHYLNITVDKTLAALYRLLDKNKTA